MRSSLTPDTQARSWPSYTTAPAAKGPRAQQAGKKGGSGYHQSSRSVLAKAVFEGGEVVQHFKLFPAKLQLSRHPFKERAMSTAAGTRDTIVAGVSETKPLTPRSILRRDSSSASTAVGGVPRKRVTFEVNITSLTMNDNIVANKNKYNY